MGLGKKLRKAWKKTFGWADDDAVKTAAIVAAAGAVTGGLGGAALGGLGLAGTTASGAAIGAGAAAKAGAIYGAIGGSALGGLQGYQTQEQKKALKAQIASSEKIAQMQQNTVISAAPIPTQTQETAAISEQNNATKKARAFRLANSVRGGTLGGGSSNNKKTTLG